MRKFPWKQKLRNPSKYYSRIWKIYSKDESKLLKNESQSTGKKNWEMAFKAHRICQSRAPGRNCMYGEVSECVWSIGEMRR